MTDRLLSDYPNMYGDLSANSGRNALSRDPEFASDFVFAAFREADLGSDCPCTTGMEVTTRRGYCIAQRSLAREGIRGGTSDPAPHHLRQRSSSPQAEDSGLESFSRSVRRP